MKRSDDETFWSKVDASGGPDSCWMWLGAANRGGYGCLGRRGSATTLAHRYSYELTVGSIPDGLHIDHLCRNRLCVNPTHLEPVTQAENNRRSLAHKTPRKPDDFHCAKGHPDSRRGVRPDGGGKCLDCHVEYQNAYLAKRRGGA